jgi:hypothetical protein
MILDLDALPDPVLGNYHVTESGSVQLTGAAALRFTLMLGLVDEVCGG